MTNESIALPQGWCWTTLGAIAEIAGGLIKNSGKRGTATTQVPLISVAAVQLRAIVYNEIGTIGILPEDGDRGALNKGDLLMVEGNGSLSHIGRVAIWDGTVADARHQNHIIRIRSKEISSPFLMEWLSSPLGREAIRQEATSAAGLYTLSLSKVTRLPVPLPPREEQSRIVSKLESLLARSRRAKEALGAIPAMLERFRQSVLAAAFRGTLTADWRAQHPDVEPLPKTLARLPVQLSPKRGSTADATPIQGRFAISAGPSKHPAPEGWTWVKLTNVARLETGHTPSRSHPEYWGGGIPWIGIKDARANHGSIIQKTEQTVTQAGLDNSAARLLPPHTVCLSRTASVGYVFVLGRSMATSQDFVCWVCSEAVVPKFLMYLLMAEGEDILRFGKGSTHTTIYFPEVMAFHVCLPSVAEQRQVVHEVETRFAAIERIREAWQLAQQSAQKLDEAVLAKAFRGELVPQDPNDEPASVLLERIRAEREATSAPSSPKRSRGRNSAA